MTKEFTKEDVIRNKKEAIRSLNQLLEGYINDTTETSKKHLKKALLISKWLKQYKNFILFEEKFNPIYNISYSRGDVVFANFGFNIGAELGGEHYAVVIDKESHNTSSTLTVIPLTSLKPDKEVHPNDLYLGPELFEKMQLKLKTLRKELLDKISADQELVEVLKEKIDALGPLADKDKEVISLLSELEKRVAAEKQELANIEKLKLEITTLKSGSIAKIKQITTISKIRIYNPKKASDPLYGVRFTEETMEKINSKLKEFYIF